MIVKLVEAYELDFTPKQNTYKMDYDLVRGGLFESIVDFEEGNCIYLTLIANGESQLQSSTITKVNIYANNEIEVHTRNTIYTFEEIKNYIAD